MRLSRNAACHLCSNGMPDASSRCLQPTFERFCLYVLVLALFLPSPLWPHTARNSTYPHIHALLSPEECPGPCFPSLRMCDGFRKRGSAGSAVIGPRPIAIIVVRVHGDYAFGEAIVCAHGVLWILGSSYHFAVVKKGLNQIAFSEG